MGRLNKISSSLNNVQFYMKNYFKITNLLTPIMKHKENLHYSIEPLKATSYIRPGHHAKQKHHHDQLD